MKMKWNNLYKCALPTAWSVGVWFKKQKKVKQEDKLAFIKHPLSRFVMGSTKTKRPKLLFILCSLSPHNWRCSFKGKKVNDSLTECCGWNSGHSYPGWLLHQPLTLHSYDSMTNHWSECIILSFKRFSYRWPPSPPTAFFFFWLPFTVSKTEWPQLSHTKAMVKWMVVHSFNSLLLKLMIIK